MILVNLTNLCIYDFVIGGTLINTINCNNSNKNDDDYNNYYYNDFLCVYKTKLPPTRTKTLTCTKYK